MPETELVNVVVPVEFLMSKAKICKGTMGPFAFVKGVSDVAVGPWADSEAKALTALRVNVERDVKQITKAWVARFGAMEK